MASGGEDAILRGQLAAPFPNSFPGDACPPTTPPSVAPTESGGRRGCVTVPPPGIGRKYTFRQVPEEETTSGAVRAFLLRGVGNPCLPARALQGPRRPLTARRHGSSGGSSAHSYAHAAPVSAPTVPWGQSPGAEALSPTPFVPGYPKASSDFLVLPLYFSLTLVDPSVAHCPLSDLHHPDFL